MKYNELSHFMNWQNNLTNLLGIDYPIVQAPMLGITSPEMVAEISNSGGLGSLPIGGLSPEKTLELIQKTKSLTLKPFAVNLFAHDIKSINDADANSMLNFLEQLGYNNNAAFIHPDPSAFRFYSYKEQIDILIKENICIVSFTFGVLYDDAITRLKSNGTLLIGTATCMEEALILQQKGVDAITAQGIEAGGHRGSFITGELPAVGVMAIVPQIIEKTGLPILASGAINDGKTIAAALALGAAAVQIGTAFIPTDESLAISSYKEAVLNYSDTDTILTKAFSGRWARGIKNSFMDAVENSGLTIPDYPIQNSLTGAIRASAQKNNNNQMTNMWAGQSAPKIKLNSSSDIFKEMVKQVEMLNR